MSQQSELAFFGAQLRLRTFFVFAGDHMEHIILEAILTGAAVGAIPFICGTFKEKFSLALGGFALCLMSSVILGLLLALPVCAIFLFFIFSRGEEDETNDE